MIKLQLTTFFSGNLEFFCCPVACSSLGCRVLPSGPIIHPAVEGFRQQSAEYMSLINSVRVLISGAIACFILPCFLQPCSESVPYQCAIQNRKTIYSSTESRESLAQQVEIYFDYPCLNVYRLFRLRTFRRNSAKLSRIKNTGGWNRSCCRCD